MSTTRPTTAALDGNGIMAKGLASDHISGSTDIDTKKTSATGGAKNWAGSEDILTVTTPRILTAPGTRSHAQSVVLVTRDEATATPLIDSTAAPRPLQVRNGGAVTTDNARASSFTGAVPTVGEVRHTTGRIESVTGWAGVQRSNHDNDDARHCERVEKEIGGRFNVVTENMEKLSNVFSGAAEILATRIRAITTISRCED